MDRNPLKVLHIQGIYAYDFSSSFSFPTIRLFLRKISYALSNGTFVLFIPGTITDAAAPKDVWHESKWSGAQLNPICLSYHTPEITHIHDPPIEIRLQAVPGASYPRPIDPGHP